ncbi:MAG: hypothetical protein WA705_16920 [Candidatus Ozemobacteraceae bacterium]
MGLWDTIKNAANDIVSKPDLQSAEKDAEKSKSSVREGPSEIVKSALSLGASTVLQTSKTLVNALVSNYHPPISFHFFTHPEEILQILELSKKYNLLSNIELAEICSNNFETLYSGKEKLKKEEAAFNDFIKAKETELANEHKKPPEKNSKKRISDLTEEIKKKRACLESFHLQEVALKIEILIKIENNDPTVKEDVKRLDSQYPNWLHPLLAKCLLREPPLFEIGPSERKTYCIKALNCSPLNKPILEALLSSATDEEATVIKQLIALAK